MASKPKVLGRPTKYDPKYCEEVIEFMAKGFSFEAFAGHIGAHKDTLYEWVKKYPEFSASLNRLKRLQKEQLSNDGVYGGKDVNPTIVKLLLQNNHGMKERNDVTTNDKDLPTPIYDGKSTKGV